MALSLKRERIFVMNNPAAEKALSATTEVGRRVLMAQKFASRRAGRWQVFLKIIISGFNASYCEGRLNINGFLFKRFEVFFNC